MFSVLSAIFVDKKTYEHMILRLRKALALFSIFCGSVISSCLLLTVLSTLVKGHTIYLVFLLVSKKRTVCFVSVW